MNKNIIIRIRTEYEGAKPVKRFALYRGTDKIEANEIVGKSSFNKISDILNYINNNNISLSQLDGNDPKTSSILNRKIKLFLSFKTEEFDFFAK